MKRFLILLFFLSLTGYSQTLYTYYDCTTFSDIGASMDLPTDPAACYTTVPRTIYVCCPKFNVATQQWYNDATPQQEAAWQAMQQANAVNPEDMEATNTALIGNQTNATLNNLYPYVQVNFRLTCKNVASGMLYIKVSSTEWQGTSLFSLPNN